MNGSGGTTGDGGLSRRRLLMLGGASALGVVFARLLDPFRSDQSAAPAPAHGPPRGTKNTARHRPNRPTRPMRSFRARRSSMEQPRDLEGKDPRPGRHRQDRRAGAHGRQPDGGRRRHRSVRLTGVRSRRDPNADEQRERDRARASDDAPGGFVGRSSRGDHRREGIVVQRRRRSPARQRRRRLGRVERCPRRGRQREARMGTRGRQHRERDQEDHPRRSSHRLASRRRSGDHPDEITG